MPEFWEFPTVSMGLGPIMAIYHARFIKYLRESRTEAYRPAASLGVPRRRRNGRAGNVWARSRWRRAKSSTISIFVVNCNLQRLDGPVRGNGKIIQELEAIFRGAGWNVIKVIWGSDWDPCSQNDAMACWCRRMGEVIDGQYQKYSVEGGAFPRKLLRHGSSAAEDGGIFPTSNSRKLRRGGHDPDKVYAAYKAAVEHRGQPTIILAKTIKGMAWAKPAKARTSPISKKR